MKNGNENENASCLVALFFLGFFWFFSSFSNLDLSDFRNFKNLSPIDVVLLLTKVSFAFLAAAWTAFLFFKILF